MTEATKAMMALINYVISRTYTITVTINRVTTIYQKKEKKVTTNL